MGKSNKKDKKSSKQKRKHKKERKSKHDKKPKQKDQDEDFAIPVELMNSKSHAPETPEEFKRRSTAMRREVDPVTGRTRLIRGESEIMEEIVSKEQHANINKEATMGDGRYFQEQTIGRKDLY